MTGDARHQRLKEALFEAQALEGAEREAYIQRLASGDAGAAEELRSLLAAEGGIDPLGHGLTAVAGEVFRRAQAEDAASTGGAREIGPYRLLEVVGSGGMGVVYRAEQRAPIRREVALKLLVGGVRAGRLSERFSAEQRALALVEHPGIARILDAGGDETGTPYIAMEFVRGVPITDYCREKRLARAAVLAIFVSVCRAVQHAHQKGIIHRDLKPANVLVAEVDGAPVPKIIDFGIARIVDIDQSETRRTILTGEGQILGTLGYMSPEQAEGRVRDIDARTDVYSLGAILYELLTGTLPHDLYGRSLAEAIEVIARDSPRPFRSTHGEGLRAGGELETITRKALDADRARRYDGVGALADDIERFLRSQPISARPPSGFYRFRKTVRRHRAAFTIGAAVFAGLLVYGVSMSVLYEAETREKEKAEAEAAKARAINEFLRESFAAASPEDMGRDVTAVQVLYRAMGRVDASFRTQPDVRAGLQQTFGETLLGLGEPARAESILTVALAERLRIHPDDHPDVFASRLALGAVAEDLSQFRRADSIAVDALARRGSGATSTERVEALRMRGRSLRSIDLGLADSLTESAYELAAKTSAADEALLGVILYERGSIAAWREERGKADSLFRSAIAQLVRTRGELFPVTLAAYNEHAMNLGALVSTDSALVLQERNLDRFVRVFGPDHLRVADARNNLATSYLMAGRVIEAESLFRQAVATWERRYGAAHNHVAVGYHNVGYALQCRGRFTDAKQWYRKQLGSTEALGDPKVLACLGNSNLASIALDLGDLADAMHWARRAWTAAQGTEMHAQRGNVLCLIAEIHLDAGRLDSALVYAGRSLAEYGLGQCRYNLNTARAIQALVLARRGQHAKADSILDAIRDPLVNGKVEWIVEKRRAYKRLTVHYRGLGRPEEVAYYQGALDRLPR